ncbi:ABC transporter permease [Phyllobacterium sp. SB3]|uniref:ABC transporter permease n=1 Tax=Phyllobacterium sp. SB3 TaxID=3156073 RepID=UPI0032AF12BB
MNLDKLKKHFPWITLVVLAIFVGLLDPNFLRPENLLQLAGDISTLFIMALGITFVIYIGGIDLSAQSVANMTTVLATLLLPLMGGFAALACIAIGAVFGLVSGFVSTRLKVPSFIATLAVGGVALSVGQYASGQKALYMDAAMREQAFGWMTGNIAGLPREMLIAAVLLVIGLVIERRMVVGRVLKAIGAGELAASASGLNVDRYKMIAFSMSGACAAIAGLLFAVKLSGGSPVIANGFLLPAIVAVLVGGTPLTGGVGGVLNTAIGALIVAVVRTSMLYLDVPATAQQIFFGLVLIVAIALTIDRSKVRTVK